LISKLAIATTALIMLVSAMACDKAGADGAFLHDVKVNAPLADIQGHAPDATLIEAGKQACKELKDGKTEADVASDIDQSYGLNSNILSINIIQSASMHYCSDVELIVDAP
jgi:hypothetical protein